MRDDYLTDGIYYNSYIVNEGNLFDYLSTTDSNSSTENMINICTSTIGKTSDTRIFENTRIFSDPYLFDESEILLTDNCKKLINVWLNADRIYINISTILPFRDTLTIAQKEILNETISNGKYTFATSHVLNEIRESYIKWLNHIRKL